MTEYMMKPGIIKAVQWTGENLREIQEFAGPENVRILIKTFLRDRDIELGQYVIRDEHGDISIADQKQMTVLYKKAEELPVVRCWQCVNKRKAKANENGILICPASGMEIADDAFCSYGKLSY